MLTLDEMASKPKSLDEMASAPKHAPKPVSTPVADYARQLWKKNPDSDYEDIAPKLEAKFGKGKHGYYDIAKNTAPTPRLGPLRKGGNKRAVYSGTDYAAIDAAGNPVTEPTQLATIDVPHPISVPPIAGGATIDVQHPAQKPAQKPIVDYTAIDAAGNPVPGATYNPNIGHPKSSFIQDALAIGSAPANLAAMAAGEVGRQMGRHQGNLEYATEGQREVAGERWGKTTSNVPFFIPGLSEILGPSAVLSLAQTDQNGVSAAKRLLTESWDIANHPIASLKSDPVNVLFTGAALLGIAHGVKSAVGAGVKGISDMVSPRESAAQAFERLSHQASPTPQETKTPPVEPKTANQPETLPQAEKPEKTSPEPVSEAPGRAPLPSPAEHVHILHDLAKSKGVVNPVESTIAGVQTLFDNWIDASDEYRSNAGQRYGMSESDITGYFRDMVYEAGKMRKTPETVVEVDKAKLHEVLATGPKTVDEIVEATGYPVNRVLSSLTVGDLSGELVKNPDGTFRTGIFSEDQAREQNLPLEEWNGLQELQPEESARATKEANEDLTRGFTLGQARVIPGLKKLSKSGKPIKGAVKGYDLEELIQSTGLSRKQIGERIGFNEEVKYRDDITGSIRRHGELTSDYITTTEANKLNASLSGKLKQRAPALASERGAVSLQPLMPLAKMVDKFVEEDIEPKVAGAVEGGSRLFKTLSPGSLAEEGAAKLREANGEAAMRSARMRQSLEPQIKQLDSVESKHPGFNLAMMDYAETLDRNHLRPYLDVLEGLPGYNHAWQAPNSIVKGWRETFDRQFAREAPAINSIAKIVGGEGIGQRKRYFPLLEKMTPKLRKFSDVTAVMHDAMFGGRAGFMKHREFETHSDFVNAGHQLASMNAAETVGIRIFEGEKARMACEYVLDAQENGRTRIVPHGDVQARDAAITEGYHPLTGPVFRGRTAQIWIPESEATLINNIFSPHLSTYGYASLRAANNALNQLQLGVSGYHGMTTMINVGATRLGQAAVEVSRGNIKGAAQYVAKSILAPVDTAMLTSRGGQIKAAYRTGTGSPEMLSSADNIARGGGRIGMDPSTEGYGAGSRHQTAYTDMVRTWLRGNKIGAISKSPMVIPEILARPVFNMVADIKLALADEMMAQELARVPEATDLQQLQIKQKVWDSIDNRFGMLVQDNLFWNNSFRDIANLSIRSVGWNLGTEREFGGAAYDLGKGAKALKQGKIGQSLSMRQAYAIALPLYVGTLGGVITKLATGENPQSILDFLAPRIGGKNADNTDRRVMLASYMKDFFSTYKKARSYNEPVSGTVFAIADTTASKASPLLEFMDQIVHNRDFRNQQIYDPDAALSLQFEQAGTFLEQMLKPISVRNIEHYGITDARSVGSFAGVTPATSQESHSDAMNALDRLHKNKVAGAGTASKEDADKWAARTPVMNKIKAGTVTPENRAGWIGPGQLFETEQSFDRFVESTLRTPRQRNIQKFKALSSGDQSIVWRKASENERKWLAPYRKGVNQ
jgi:hypothetical protein